MKKWRRRKSKKKSAVVAPIANAVKTGPFSVAAIWRFAPSKTCAVVVRTVEPACLRIVAAGVDLVSPAPIVARVSAMYVGPAAGNAVPRRGRLVASSAV